jgi:regulator of RNase E activity RraA
LAAGLLCLADPDAVMAVMPADHVIPDVASFQAAIRYAVELIARQPEAIVTFGIKPMYPDNAVFFRPALTALAYPADVFGVFGALMEAEAGDVIVVANDAYTATAVIGDLVAGMMHNKGVAAFVTDGLARDRAGIVASRLPLFAAGSMPASPAANGPAVVGAPVTLGGQHVRPGDIIVGDADGVIVVPQDQAEVVLEKLVAVRAAEARAIAAVEAGATANDKMRAIVGNARIIGK